VRRDLPDAPLAWLSSGPITIPNPQAVLATFRPGTVKVVQFSGPHRLLRAAGWDATTGRLASAYGSWWADELILGQIGARLEKFESLLPPDLLRKAWPAQYRGASALCEDWNDMREMFQLQLPPGDVITGLAGIAAAQPKRSNMNPTARSTPILPGGGEQIYFKRTHALNSVNPLWVYQTTLW
jgi:hypothetical protein